jgi:hypothetical protein
VRAALARLTPALELTRVTIAFAAIGNTWFVILWTNASDREAMPGPARDLALSLQLLAGGVVALGLYAFGAALNDVIDRRRDRSLHPERPLPAGRLSIEAAIAITISSLLAAIAAASVFGLGGVRLATLVGVAILIFNGAARFVPSLGAVALGLIYAAHMLVPNVNLRFIWPVLLVMTFALVVATMAHVVSKRRPTLSTRSLIAAALAWGVWAAALLYVGHRRTGAIWPEWTPWTAVIGPACAIAAYAVLAWFTIRSQAPPLRAADRMTRLGAAWLVVINTAWLLSFGQFVASVILGGFALLALAAVTGLREIYTAIERPLAYRR